MVDGGPWVRLDDHESAITAKDAEIEKLRARIKELEGERESAWRVLRDSMDPMPYTSLAEALTSIIADLLTESENAFARFARIAALEEGLRPFVASLEAQRERWVAGESAQWDDLQEQRLCCARAALLSKEKP